MGRIVGQIAKWPREPQNLSLDSGNLRHARCALRGEAGDYVIPSNPYGELSGSSRAWREFSELPTDDHDSRTDARPSARPAPHTGIITQTSVRRGDGAGHPKLCPPPEVFAELSGRNS